MPHTSERRSRRPVRLGIDTRASRREKVAPPVRSKANACRAPAPTRRPEPPREADAQTSLPLASLPLASLPLASLPLASLPLAPPSLQAQTPRLTKHSQLRRSRLRRLERARLPLWAWGLVAPGSDAKAPREGRSCSLSGRPSGAQVWLVCFASRPRRSSAVGAVATRKHGPRRTGAVSGTRDGPRPRRLGLALRL